MNAQSSFSLCESFSMAPSSAIQFIDAALTCTSPFALSYTDPNQNWIIRKHLISLLQDYPVLVPSTDTFTHNDGTIVNLLYATGHLQISHELPPIPLTIWIHENYPYFAPMVFVSSDSTYPIHPNHPFVRQSGFTTSPYLETWSFPGCTLSDAMRNLVKIFSHDHPFSFSPICTFTHPSLVSKLEAIDRLAGTLHYDMVALQVKTNQELDELSKLQEKMIIRVHTAKTLTLDLEQEKMNLKRRVMELTEQADVLRNWLRVYESRPIEDDEREEAFEAANLESKQIIDCLAADKGIEDSIYALDKAVDHGILSFDVYIRHVRILAREQFFNRAMLVKLKDPGILHWLD